MPTGVEISTELNDYRLQGVNAFLAAGTPNAYADIFDGVRPAFKQAGAGKLLVRIPLVKPFGTVPGNGTLVVSATPEVMIGDTGIATWARVCNGDNVVGWDCDVSDLDGSGQLKLASTTLYAGGMTRIVSGVLA